MRKTDDKINLIIYICIFAVSTTVKVISECLREHDTTTRTQQILQTNNPNRRKCHRLSAGRYQTSGPSLPRRYRRCRGHG